MRFVVCDVCVSPSCMSEKAHGDISVPCSMGTKLFTSWKIRRYINVTFEGLPLLTSFQQALMLGVPRSSVWS